MPRRLLAAAALTLIGCADLTSPTSSLAGDWVGESHGTVARFVLLEDGDRIEGTGSVSGLGGNVPVQVTGRVVWRTVSLTLTAPGTSPATFTGLLTSRGLVGTLASEAIGEVAISLTRD